MDALRIIPSLRRNRAFSLFKLIKSFKNTVIVAPGGFGALFGFAPFVFACAVGFGDPGWFDM